MALNRNPASCGVSALPSWLLAGQRDRDRGNRVTIPLEMLQVAVEELSRCPRRPGELLRTHAAEMLAVDVKLLERDAAGVQLVGVQEVLEPLPHLVLGPVLRMDFMPLASKKPAGNCKTGVGPVSDPCLFPSMNPDMGMPFWLPDVTGVTTTLCVHPWGLEREMGSGEEALGNAILSPVVVGANHSASVDLHFVLHTLTPELWMRTQHLKCSEIMSSFPTSHKLP